MIPQFPRFVSFNSSTLLHILSTPQKKKRHFAVKCSVDSKSCFSLLSDRDFHGFLPPSINLSINHSIPFFCFTFISCLRFVLVLVLASLSLSLPEDWLMSLSLSLSLLASLIASDLCSCLLIFFFCLFSFMGQLGITYF